MSPKHSELSEGIIQPLPHLPAAPPTSPPHPPHQIKPFYVSGKKNLTEIYRNILKIAFQVLQKCGSWASRNGAV